MKSTGPSELVGVSPDLWSATHGLATAGIVLGWIWPSFIAFIVIVGIIAAATGG